jgi:hypothetical protein
MACAGVATAKAKAATAINLIIRFLRYVVARSCEVFADNHSKITVKLSQGVDSDQSGCAMLFDINRCSE